MTSALAAPRSRPNRTGRNKGKFVALPHAIITSQRFRTLSPGAVKVLVHVVDRFNGSNNGKLAFPVRAGRDIGLSQSTTARALRELVEAGFLAIEVKGTANPTKMGARRATEYSLTWHPVNGRAPSNAWRMDLIAPKFPSAISDASKCHMGCREAS